MVKDKKREMKPIITLFIILSLFGCAVEPTDTDDLTRIQINLIKDRCESLEGEAGELDCFKEYSEALSTALSEFINVEIYGAE